MRGRIPEKELLDMGTGGGEFLLTLGHPGEHTTVTEGYPPNVQLCRQRLEPLGIQVVDSVKKHFKSRVFATAIPRNVRLGEAPSHGLPIHMYDPRSLGADSYRRLAQEFLQRNR